MQTWFASVLFLGGGRIGTIKCVSTAGKLDTNQPTNILSVQYSLTVKVEEKRRLERVLREEESQLASAEAELRLAQQAFDQFLQEKDRNAVEAQKKRGGGGQRDRAET